MNHRRLRYLNQALKESLKSPFKGIKIGAVIVDGNYVVSKGYNRNTSHPLQKKYNDKVGRIAPDHNGHAEIIALVRSRDYDLTGCEIFVGRFDRKGKLAMCRPCRACMEAIRAAGISRITYTTPEGIKSEIIG